MTPKQLFTYGVIGLITGYIGGFIGMRGGSILIPVMVHYGMH